MKSVFCPRWIGDRQGVTAIEFSLLALPFIMFVIGIIELAMMFAGTFLLQGSVSEAARLIRTGQVQQSVGGDPREIFRETLCAEARILLDCDRVQFDVRTIERFRDAGARAGIDEDGNLENTSFEAGGVSDIVIVRAAYLYPLMTPMIGRFFADYPNNRKLLLSTVVFQTEPYDFEDDD